MSKEVDVPSSNDRKATRRRRAQQFAFSILYRVGGAVYDPFTRLLFGDAWSRWRRSIIPLAADGPVLDLGCGTGALVDEFTQLGVQAFGVDRESSMLRGARSKLGAQGRLARADARQLPFADGAFGTVTATFPAPFILERTTLNEVVRVLRPGGAFVVVMTGETSEHRRWRWPLQALLRLFYGDSGETTTPASDVLAHEWLAGEWDWVQSGPDRMLIWTARRIAETGSATSPTP